MSDPRLMRRREFVEGLVAGGLVFAVAGTGCRRLSGDAPTRKIPDNAFEPAVYVRLDDRGAVTVICHRSEMGQGIRTTLAMAVAVGSSRVDLQACKLEYSIVSPK